MSKLKEILFLKSIKGFGKKNIYMRYFEDLEKVDNLEDLKELVRSKEKHICEEELLKAEQKAEDLYQNIRAQKDITVITVMDKSYPKQLQVMRMERPLILYVKGSVDVLNDDNIAIIGTRKPSEWSKKVEQRLVRKIADISDRVVISGLALACDKIAHETIVKE